SPRAAQVLGSVAAICAEDTRHTRQLLAQIGVSTPLLALHEHNEEALAPRLVERLRAGESLALVSDAGTPLVSDPGCRLVRAAREGGIRVSAVPGPCALVAALSVAGLPSDRFVFEGFAPADEPCTLIFYESAHRIHAMLADAAAAFGGDRRAVVARELTKLFETVLDGTLDALLARVGSDADQRRGEFVVVVEGAGEDGAARLAEGRRVYALLAAELRPSLAAKLAAEITGAPRKALYGG